MTKQLRLDDLPEMLTVSEVAALLRVHPHTLTRSGRRKTIPCIRINSHGDRRYTRQAVLDFIKNNEEGNQSV
jgi:DNA-binding transcriptional MerR regulator